MDAHPPPDRFFWSVNSTQDGLHVVPQNQFEWFGNISRFTYTPPVSLAKMLVLCWAMNTQGRTKHPCTITLIQAGMPERVQSCTVVEQRVSSLKVTCTPGFNGGLQQRFIAMVLEPGEKHTVANVTVDDPEFTIGGLTPGFDYTVKVFAFNSRGRSEPYILDGFSLKVAENRMDSGDEVPIQDVSPLLAHFIGVLAAFVLTLTVIIVATKLKCRVRAFSLGSTGGGKSEESDDGAESRGNEKKSTAEEKLRGMRILDCDERAMGTLSLHQQQQQRQQMQQQSPQQTQQHQLYFGVHPSHEIGKNNQ
ncbi:uncharacterized protein LOC126981611 [Eriocheir sinensis]|uniref:uncharacterized protein LOC126981611 n=1 Tax=Eriocheir sinensis TaxID=95602 RepID=UPI0021C9CB23|nr:uncharacterized protein LOC126981611 [Eriocheir sinensis]